MTRKPTSDEVAAPQVVTFDAILPGSISEGARAIWQLEAVRVYDGGADGQAATGPNTLFEQQGIFVP